MSLAPSLLNLSRTGLPPIEFFVLIFPLSLLHSKPLRPIVWAVGWPKLLQRRHYIDGQFDDADFKAEAWTCVSPECNNIFYTRQNLNIPGDYLRCLSCGSKAFRECEVAAAH